MSELSLSQTPPGGWQFVQAQTGWQMPTPIAWTFGQAVDLIRKHRMANPAITQKHNLATDFNSVAAELEAFTRTRLNLGAPTDPPPLAPGAAPRSSRCCGQ